MRPSGLKQTTGSVSCEKLLLGILKLNQIRQCFTNLENRLTFDAFIAKTWRLICFCILYLISVFVVMKSLYSSQLLSIILQTILAAGSHLLSEDHMTSWQDLTITGQQGVASHLVTAVETSSFTRADLSHSPETFIVDYSNIGRLQNQMFSFHQGCTTWGVTPHNLVQRVSVHFHKISI